MATVFGGLRSQENIVCKSEHQSGVDESTLAARAPKTSAAKASGALKSKPKEEPLIDLGVKEAKKKDNEWSSWENDAWESLSK